MNSEKKPLAVRRAHLIAECAQQRGDIAYELNLLKAPVERISGVGQSLMAKRKALLAGGGVALGLLIARPKPVLALVATGVSAWKIVQNVLPSVMPVVQRVLPVLRERFGGRFQ
ncbi:YqjK family protein [Massilia sp. YIM B02769]|uniref:YqjK family protein n=1 Tax=unclassified Massilia TaxID=2609279 RepID=UPI0025B72A72|nr:MULTISPECIES: YqjK family protein [unclassified Massilia]MDN4060845.1 YqjK family protein [Massilia sp. YIM B02769]